MRLHFAVAAHRPQLTIFENVVARTDSADVLAPSREPATDAVSSSSRNFARSSFSTLDDLDAEDEEPVPASWTFDHLVAAPVSGRGDGGLPAAFDVVAIGATTTTCPAGTIPPGSGARAGCAPAFLAGCALAAGCADDAAAPGRPERTGGRGGGGGARVMLPFHPGGGAPAGGPGGALSFCCASSSIACNCAIVNAAAAIGSGENLAACCSKVTSDTAGTL